jgi:hypothetical protein
MDGLRITDTNSANDSKGRAFGMEGNDFIYVLIGGVVALGLYLLLAIMFGVGKIVALVLVLPFLLGPLGWVVFLRHNKPEGYAEDWFDQTFSGAGFTLAPHMQPAPVVRSRDESGT